MAAPLRFRDWWKRLEKEGPAGATFLCGPESLLRDLAVRRIKERVFGEGAATAGHDRFYGDEGPVSQVTVALASVGLFTGTRLVTLADAEKAGRAGAADRRELLSALKHGTPGSVFVATSDLTFRELERKSEWTRGLLENCQVVEVAHPTPAEALEWVAQECRRRNLALSAEAGAYLLSHVGPDLQELSRELEKLELASAPGEKLTLEEIQEMTRKGELGSGWEFCQAVLEGRTGAALRLLDGLARTEAVLRMQWLLQRQARDRLARPSRSPLGVRLSDLLAEAYALERGIKSGRIPSGGERNALDFLVVSTGAGTPRVPKSPKTDGMRRT
jgi:DNA polymerase III delta subunit